MYVAAGIEPIAFSHDGHSTFCSTKASGEMGCSHGQNERLAEKQHVHLKATRHVAIM